MIIDLTGLDQSELHNVRYQTSVTSVIGFSA